MKWEGEMITAAGVILMMIFGSALDGPDESMNIVYIGCVVSLAIIAAGCGISGRREKGMGKYIIKNFSTLTDAAAIGRVALLVQGNIKEAQGGNIKILVKENQDSKTYILMDKKEKEQI